MGKFNIVNLGGMQEQDQEIVWRAVLHFARARSVGPDECYQSCGHAPRHKLMQQAPAAEVAMPAAVCWPAITFLEGMSFCSKTSGSCSGWPGGRLEAYHFLHTAITQGVSAPCSSTVDWKGLQIVAATGKSSVILWALRTGRGRTVQQMAVWSACF